MYSNEIQFLKFEIVKIMGKFRSITFVVWRRDDDCENRFGRGDIIG